MIDRDRTRSGLRPEHGNPATTVGSKILARAISAGERAACGHVLIPPNGLAPAAVHARARPGTPFQVPGVRSFVARAVSRRWSVLWARMLIVYAAAVRQVQ